LIADGAGSEFDVAAWGPNTAQTGGPDFYNVTLTPKDPASAARQLKTEVPEGSVPNAIEDFEIKKLGSGRIFERSKAELDAGKASGKNLPKFYGHALVLLPLVRVTSTSPPGTGRSTTSTRATPNCTTSRPRRKHVPQELAGPRGPHALLITTTN
jgi:hypothetical protein